MSKERKNSMENRVLNDHIPAIQQLNGKNGKLKPSDNHETLVAEINHIDKIRQVLLHNAKQALLFVDTDFRLMECNVAAGQLLQKLTGRRMVTGEKLDEFGSPDMTEFWLNLLRIGLKGEARNGEVQETCANTDILWLSYSISPVFNDFGNVEAVTVELDDITDKKITSHRLNQTDRLLQSIFDTSSAGICITDTHGFYVDVNTKFCDIYGYTREELIGNHFCIVVPEEHTAMLIDQHDRFIAGEVELDAEWVVQRKDGKRIDVYATARLLEYEDGNRFKITSIHDITDKKKYKELANVTQEKGQIGGWELDALSRALSYTVETANIFGVDVELEPTLDDMYAIFADEGALALERAVKEAVALGKPFDLEVQTETEAARWIRITCKPILVHNTTMKLFGTVQDVSARRNFEATLLEKNKKLSIIETKLRRSLKEKEILLAEIHHRVKNNLAVVSSMMQMQLMDETDELVCNKLYDSITRISTMAAIHEDLYKTNDFSDVNFTSVIGKLVDSVGTLLSGTRDIKIKTDMADFRLDMNQAIPSALILNEVITNIYKHAFGCKGGDILVRTRINDEEVLIEVLDNGKGLPESISLEETGTLGMQIIRTLTEQLIGRSSYERLEPGTRFKLSFVAVRGD